MLPSAWMRSWRAPLDLTVAPDQAFCFSREAALDLIPLPLIEGDT